MKHNLEPEDKGKVGFYLVTNPNTLETYAGSGDLVGRQKAHESALKNGRHFNYKLQAAFNRDPNFEFVGLPLQEQTPQETRELAFEFEQSFVDVHVANPLLLNLAVESVRMCGGPKQHTEETKEKNRAATTDRWQDPAWREKVMAAQREGWASLTEQEWETHRQQRSAIMKKLYDSGARTSTAGQIRPDSFREHDSKVIAEKWQDPDYRAKQCAARVGNRNAPMKAVMIDGVHYESLKDAANAVGMSTPGVVYRIESAKWPTWSYT